MSNDVSARSRATVTSGSRPALAMLSRLPTWLVPGVVLALVLVGLFAPPGVGVPALALVALFVGWLGYLSWPVLPVAGKGLRVGVFIVVVAVAVGRASGQL